MIDGFPKADPTKSQAKNFDAKNLQSTYEKDLSYVEGKYGSPWLLCHRADLHNELKLLATQEDGAGKPVKVRLGSGVDAIVRQPFDWNSPAHKVVVQVH